MGTIYNTIIAEHSDCFKAWLKEGSRVFNCVAITPDDELLCTNCGEIIKV